MPAVPGARRTGNCLLIGSRLAFARRLLTCRENMPDDITDPHFQPGLGHMRNRARCSRLDFNRRLVAVDLEQHVAFSDTIPGLLQPAGDDTDIRFKADLRENHGNGH
jgi:hypothetical protein